MNNPIFHVILVSLYPVIWLYSTNLHQALFTDILIPVLIMTPLSLLIMLILNKFTKNIKLSAVSVSTSIIVVFSYGPFKNLLKSDYLVSFLLILILFLLIFYFKKNSVQLNKINRFFNLLAVFLFILPLFSIIQYGVFSKNISNDYRADLKIWNTKPSYSVQYPDIYYFIFDRYASAKTLKEVFDFDNSEFTKFLTSTGFFVAEDSWANYYSTGHSLASSLNMVYLDDLIATVRKTDRDWKKLYQLITDHQVGKNLKSLGYKYYHFGSWWWPTSKNKMANFNVNLGLLSEFSTVLLSNSLFYPLASQFNPPIVDSRYTQWRRINYQFAKLAEIPQKKEATFVFAHFIIPHEPYIFEANGNFLTSVLAGQRNPKGQYVDQIKFLNSRMQSLINGILINEKNSIIILQSDEGPYPESYEKNKNQFDWTRAASSEIRQKMSILNAIYLPKADYSGLNKDFSPVNTFRVVFNNYLGAKLELLPNRYFLGNMSYPYNLFEVNK